MIQSPIPAQPQQQPIQVIPATDPITVTNTAKDYFDTAMRALVPVLLAYIATVGPAKPADPNAPRVITVEEQFRDEVRASLKDLKASIEKGACKCPTVLPADPNQPGPSPKKLKITSN